MRKTREINPGQFLILGYLCIIALGAAALTVPGMTRQGITPVDAIFTATSAVCVTGLIVKDTAVDFTLIGKIVILVLIQIGGIGYMTLSTTFFFFWGRRVSLRNRLVFKESANLLNYDNIGRFAWRVFRITLAVEAAGMLVLFLAFLRSYAPLHALGHACFHSVSAFCNAGFSTFSENLTRHADSYLIPITVATLVFTGGIGFVVISDLYATYIQRKKKNLLLHSKLALRTSLILIAVATIVILVYEGPRSMAHLGLGQRLLHSFFQAVTPRTAGFNTVPIQTFSAPILVFLIVLMFIGASPSGTGGGVKTTTIVVYLGWIKNLLYGRTDKDVPIARKSVALEQAMRAALLVALSLALVLVAWILLLAVENAAPMRAAFEVVSAFGTVGLSLGSTLSSSCNYAYDLGPFGKLVLVLVMITGKVGTITIGSALLKPRPQDYTYPTETVAIG